MRKTGRSRKTLRAAIALRGYSRPSILKSDRLGETQHANPIFLFPDESRAFLGFSQPKAWGQEGFLGGKTMEIDSMALESRAKT